MMMMGSSLLNSSMSSNSAKRPRTDDGENARMLQDGDQGDGRDDNEDYVHCFLNVTPVPYAKVSFFSKNSLFQK